MVSSAARIQSNSGASGTLLLVVGKKGEISTLLEGPEAIADRVARKEIRTVDDIWPDSVARQVRSAINKTLKARRHCCEEIEFPNTAATCEFIFVPQGPSRVMLIVRDLSAQKQALTRIRQLAYTDEATGLPNREYLLRELQKITDMQSLKEGRAALICLHVGNFDDHGYALNASQQDDVMAELAVRLSRHVRGANNLGEEDFERFSITARTDYRQFGIVLPSIESGEDAEAVIVRLIADLKKPVAVGSRSVTVKACGGVALFPQDGTEPAVLFEGAVAAMQDAVNDLQVDYKFHSGTVRLRTLQRQDLEIELRSALERQLYALNYLPVIDARNGSASIVEALLRWPDTLLGTQSTRKVVRVAERTGLIVPIGEWVFRQACEQLRTWQEAGHEQLRVAINLSSQELVSDRLIERLAGILEETDVRPGDVEIELKEHMLFREVLKDFATCRRLKALGLRIVIDDYGIGACSLAHLSQCPIDAIKIDNTFVAHLEDSERDRAACGAAIAMADKLGIDVIAEGVETDAQARILQDHGCRYLQGFLFSKPMSSADCSKFLSQSSAEADVGNAVR